MKTTQPPREEPFEQQVELEVADLSRNPEPAVLSSWIGVDERSPSYPAHRIARLCVSTMVLGFLIRVRFGVVLTIIASFLIALRAPFGAIGNVLAATTAGVFGLYVVLQWMKPGGTRAVLVSQIFWQLHRQRVDYSIRELNRLCHVLTATSMANFFSSTAIHLAQVAFSVYLFFVAGWISALGSLAAFWLFQRMFVSMGLGLVGTLFALKVSANFEATAAEWEAQGQVPGDRSRRSMVFRNLKTGRNLRTPNLRGSFMLAFGDFFGPLFATLFFFLPVTWFAVTSWLAYTPAATLASLFGIWVAGKAVRIAKRSDSRQFRSVLLRPFIPGPANVARKAMTPVMGSVGAGTTVEDSNFSMTRFVWSPYMLPMDVITGADCVVPYLKTDEWRNDVERLIEDSDAAIIDVTEMSEHVQWEIDTAMNNLPIQRLVFVAMDGDFARLTEFAESKPNRDLVLRVVRIGYGNSYLANLRLRSRLLEAFENMR